MVFPARIYRPANKAPTSVQHAAVSMADEPRTFGWIIHPGAMPAGSALFIEGGPEKVSRSMVILMGTVPVVLTSSKVPRCVPLTP
jgi:hypothetical protein